MCPFHNEKSPSFTVSDDKGFYHCFGCSAHGSVFDFVMNTENLQFPEAVEQLPRGRDGSPANVAAAAEAARRSATLHEVLDKAAAWYADNWLKRQGPAPGPISKTRASAPANDRVSVGLAPECPHHAQGCAARTRDQRGAAH